MLAYIYFRYLGLSCKIPVEVFRPLMDIVNNITELCGRSAHRHVMLSTDELKLKYGNIIKKEHKVALNQLTKILNRGQTNVDITGPTFKHSAALNKNERVIKRPEILSDLTGKGTEHLQSHSMNSAECSALQLLQQYHHEVSKQRPSEPSKRKRGPPQKREVHTDVHFSRMHHSEPGSRAAHQHDPDQDKAQSPAPRHSKRLRSAKGQSQRRHTGQDQVRSKTLSKQLYSRTARATRTANVQGRRQELERKSALKARHKRKNGRKARYARRDAKDDDDRSGRKLWLEYKKRSAKPGNKRKREETRHIHPETPMMDSHACSTRHARGERCPVSPYLTPLTDRQVQCEFDSWINELKQQAVCNRKERSTARLCIQSTGKLPQTWSSKQYWQHMRWYSQEPRIVTYLYGPQERIECITNDCYDNGQRKFLVHWGDTYMYAKHIALHEQDGYKAKKHTRCPTAAKLHGPIGRLQIKKVEWEPSWEPADIGIPQDMIDALV